MFWVITTGVAIAAAAMAFQYFGWVAPYPNYRMEGAIEARTILLTMIGISIPIFWMDWLGRQHRTRVIAAVEQQRSEARRFETLGQLAFDMLVEADSEGIIRTRGWRSRTLLRNARRGDPRAHPGRVPRDRRS